MLSLILTVVGLTLVVPSMVIFVEVISAVCLRQRGLRTSFDLPKGPIAVLVPAHDESHGIASTLDDIARQLRSCDRLMVVADNCSDDTADVALDCGAEVVVRNDPARRGKGYALSYGLDFLAQDPPDVVIVIDADCRVSSGNIRRLGSLCFELNRPVQSRNLMKAPEGEKRRFAVAEFAWLVRNVVRPLGMSALGLPCPLTGTGMAFPWQVIRLVDLATSNVVEDQKLGLDLTRNGYPPVFCPEVLVESEFPLTETGVIQQRQRWEHGSLKILFQYGGRTIVDALISRNVPLLVLALDTMVPPLALHAAATSLACIVASFAFFLGIIGPVPIAIAAVASVLFAASIAISWLMVGRKALPFQYWPALISYLLAKVKIYGSFRRRPSREWTRTERTKKKQF